jgi:hypothetical protein
VVISCAIVHRRHGCTVSATAGVVGDTAGLRVRIPDVVFAMP